MSGITFSIHRWFIALVSAFFIGSLLMSNHMSVPTMHLEGHADESTVAETAASSAVAGPESKEDHHTSSELCCNECCSFCVFLAIQSVYVAPYGDNEEVVNSDPVIQSISIKSITPPPKA